MGILGGLAGGLGSGSVWLFLQSAYGLQLSFLVLPCVALVIALGVRFFGRETDRRFGCASAGLALLICPAVDVCSAWCAFVSQVRPEGFLCPTAAEVLALAPECWDWAHLFDYGLAAWVGYHYSFPHPPLAPVPGTHVGPWPFGKVLVLVVASATGLLAFLFGNATRGRIEDIAVSPDGQTFAVVRQQIGTAVILCDMDGQRHSPPSSFNGPVAWDPAGDRIAIAGFVEADARSPGRFEVRFFGRDGKGGHAVAQPPSALRCLAFSPDWRTLAMGGIDRVVRLADARCVELPDALPHRARVLCLAFAPAGDFLAVGLADGTLAVWDVARRQQLSSWPAHRAEVRGLVFAADGRALFSTGLGDAAVSKWAPADGRLLCAYPLPVSWVTRLTLSPDGRTLAVAGGSFHAPGTVHLLEVDSGQVRGRFTVPVNTVSVVAFTPDGRTLVAGTVAPINFFSGDWSGRIHRWDLATGQEMPPLP
jgi:hypothetical protein